MPPHKTTVTQQLWKLTAQLFAHIQLIVGLEVAETHLMEVNDDRQYLTQTYSVFSLTLSCPGS